MFKDVALAILDVLIVTFMFYRAFMIFQDTRAFSILKGVVLILVLWLISGVMGLETLKFIISQLFLYGILAVIILFQPEIRNALEKIGKRNLNYKAYLNKEPGAGHRLIEDIVESSTYLSKHRIGALIVLELDDSLQEYLKTGINLNANVSKELLINIFTPNVPLHDGALIIKEGRAEAASCVLRLSTDETISKELGTRHRAGLGISEITDALTIIVSEETGAISITKDGSLNRALSVGELRTFLENVLLPKKEESKFNWKGGSWNK